jgi:putative hydrolase of the HAD superfamily
MTALLVDFGGVLTTSVHAAFAAFSTRLGAEPGFAVGLLSRDAESSRLLVEHESGRLSDEDFEAGFAARLAAHGHAVEPAGLIARLQADLRPDPAMIDGLAALRAAGTPVAIVSNSFGRDCYAGFDLPAMADAVVISGDVGVRKPSRRIYAIACERLGAPPRDCVLIDDVAHNLDGAARLGIAGVLHRDATATLAELEERFGLTTAEVAG